jgi:enamine deaminase RidA (YjgF/YER057c/UK114 family)
MKKILLFPALFICLIGLSQKDTSLVKFINPPSLSTPRGYSHTAQINLGNCTMLIISGQVALDKTGNLIGKGDIAKQTEQVFLNIKNAITDAGGTMNDIVKLGYFLLDVSQIQTVRDTRDKFINTKTPPASTLVQVSKLFRDDLMVEIEATAIIDNN